MNIANEIENTYPLSPLQQGMLFHTLLDPGSGVDIEQLLCELHEALDVAAFQRAWRCVVARHPVLRTNLHWENLNEPRQEVHAEVELPWEEHDWRGIAGGERDRRIAEFLGADRLRGFNLTRAPLFRLTLLRYGEAEFRLIWTFHHEILEGRSYLLALREVFAFYEALRQGSEITLPQPRPYRDYIAWLQQQDFSKDEAFWRETLKGFTTLTPLVVDHAPDTHHDGNPGHGTQEVLLSTQITSALRALAHDNQLTLNTIVQGAWALLLSRYSGEADVVFGVIRGNRRFTIEGAEAMIGLFLNTLPLRIRVNREAALIPWLKKVRLQWKAMHGHAHTPLAYVQAWSEVPAGSPLFQSTMMFEDYDLDTMLRKQGGAWSNRRFRLFLQTNYPLDLAACDGTELRLRIDFNRSRIDADAVGRMLGHLRTLLEAIATHPQRKLGELPLLNSAERQQLLVEWNQTAAGFPRNWCIQELFEAQVERTPEAIAVTFEDQHLSYRELNQRSNQLAHHLTKLGVGPEVLVGIYAQRSLEMVVGLLGILKAGGAYVPIDPTYPAERVAFMLHDASASVVLAQQNLIQTLPVLRATKVVSLDEREWATSNENTDNPARTATGNNLAYVIYTSGTTGQPKGAMIPHRAIVNHIQWMQATFPMNERDCVLQKTEFSFDVSVWEFFAPLLVGARLVVTRSGGHQDPAYLVGTIIQHQVTILQLVPSQLRMLLETSEFKNCHSLRHVFCGGEVMTEDIPRRFFATLNAGLHNLYGPTEAAIDSVYYSIPREHINEIVPIGRPVANTQAYVLDRHCQLVPIGVTGELCLGGIQVGRGYYNQPELTAERFIPDVFSNAQGARLYKTGDTARFLPDGNIEFLGRIDHQVKIRGYRIELGEIEAVLGRLPQVQEAVVVVREDEPGDRRVVAYVVPNDGQADVPGDLRSVLKQYLPDYMVPSAFVMLDKLPLTPSGKVDRGALPATDSGRQLKAVYVPPRTEWELKLADIWQEVLRVEKVGVDDNFFELGGHSLMIVRLIYEINRTHKVSLGVPEFFRNPTVGQLAKVIDRQRSKSKRQPAVIQLQEGRAEVPVYFIYAGPDESRLAQWMGGRHPVFGIEVPWPLAWRNAVADNRRSAFPNMEQLVAPFVAALSAHARSSPCVLAGHSFAGLIAFEAAHRFQKQGGKVEMVVLFDTWARFPSPYQVARHDLRDYWKPASSRLRKDRFSLSIEARLKSSWLVTRWLLVQQKNKVSSFFKRPVPNPDNLTSLLDEQGMPLPWELLQRLYLKIEDSYRPRRLDSRGVLFRADSINEKKAVRAFDDSLGWKNLFTRGLEIIPITADHLSMIREHDSILARKLNHVLERHWPSEHEEDRRPACHCHSKGRVPGE